MPKTLPRCMLCVAALASIITATACARKASSDTQVTPPEPTERPLRSQSIAPGVVFVRKAESIGAERSLSAAYLKLVECDTGFPPALQPSSKNIGPSRDSIDLRTGTMVWARLTIGQNVVTGPTTFTLGPDKEHGRNHRKFDITAGGIPGSWPTPAPGESNFSLDVRVQGCQGVGAPERVWLVRLNEEALGDPFVGEASPLGSDYIRFRFNSLSRFAVSN